MEIKHCGFLSDHLPRFPTSALQPPHPVLHRHRATEEGDECHDADAGVEGAGGVDAATRGVRAAEHPAADGAAAVPDDDAERGERGGVDVDPQRGPAEPAHRGVRAELPARGGVPRGVGGGR